MLCLTPWFSRSYRGRAVSGFFFPTLAATVAGASLSPRLVALGGDLQP